MGGEADSGIQSASPLYQASGAISLLNVLDPIFLVCDVLNLCSLLAALRIEAITLVKAHSNEANRISYDVYGECKLIYELPTADSLQISLVQFHRTAIGIVFLGTYNIEFHESVSFHLGKVGISFF